MKKNEKLVSLVSDALKNAEEGGYGDQLRGMALDEQVNDLRDAHSDIARFRHRDVFAAVTAYRSAERCA